MKRLNKEISLIGQLETISITDFRKRPGEVMQSVSFGKVYIITKQSQPVAVLSKIPGEVLAMGINKAGSISYEL